MLGRGTHVKGTDMTDVTVAGKYSINFINDFSMTSFNSILLASDAVDGSFSSCVHFSTHGHIRGGDFQGRTSVVCHVNKTHSR